MIKVLLPEQQYKELLAISPEGLENLILKLIHQYTSRLRLDDLLRESTISEKDVVDMGAKIKAGVWKHHENELQKRNVAK